MGGGLRKVTDDMKTKNRADRSGVVTIPEREGRAISSANVVSKTGPPILELQMGRKKYVILMADGVYNRILMCAQLLRDYCSQGAESLDELLSAVLLNDELQQAKKSVKKAETEVLLKITKKIQVDLNDVEQVFNSMSNF